jgi:hypothetical protein
VTRACPAARLDALIQKIVDGEACCKAALR